MKFYTFGQPSRPVLLLLPGTCCSWRSFQEVVPLLTPDFYVVCASYDGFDETENTIFPDMLTETQKIEAYLQETFGGRICAAYGCSLGGSFVGLLVQCKNVHIDHGILGSSNLDQAGPAAARLQAAIAAPMLHKMLQKGQMPGWMKKRLAAKSPEDRPYYEKMLKLFGMDGEGRDYIQQASIRNQFYSDLVTPLADGISVPGTTVHIFYAVRMGAQYRARYERHFRDADIRLHNLQHEELLVWRPQEWAAEVRRCCGLEAQTERG